jgi:pyrroloquinoline quinone (PQQ) biosynthesis protein C
MQLIIAQQTVSELMPAAEEVASLRAPKAEARRDADEAGEKVLALLERAHKDEEVASVIKKEWDEWL